MCGESRMHGVKEGKIWRLSQRITYSYYGIGVLSALEVTENVTNQLANKSFAEAGMLLATNFEAKQ